MTPQQAPRKKQSDALHFAIVDEQLLGKQNRKAFKTAAYYMGMGIGLFVFSVLLPDADGPDAEKVRNLIVAFHTLAWALIASSIGIGLGFIFLRTQVQALMFVLNWFILPTIAINFGVRVYELVTGHGI